MAPIVQSLILGLRGRCVKSVSWEDAAGELLAHCRYDARFVPVAYRAGTRGAVIGAGVSRAGLAAVGSSRDAGQY